jgi:hypothetical protein
VQPKVEICYGVFVTKNFKEQPITLYHLCEQELWVTSRVGSSTLHLAMISTTATRVKSLFQKNFTNTPLDNGQQDSDF